MGVALQTCITYYKDGIYVEGEAFAGLYPNTTEVTKHHSYVYVKHNQAYYILHGEDVITNIGECGGILFEVSV